MKKGWVWVLPIVIGLLLLWTAVRERFEATSSIKAPPYDDAETKRIADMMPPESKDAYLKFLRSQPQPSSASKELLERMDQDQLAAAPARVVGMFYEQVYSKATTPITEANIDANKPPEIPSDMWPIFRPLLVAYFVKQSGVGTSAQTGYDAKLTEVQQPSGYLNTTTPTGPVPPQGVMTTGELSPYGAPGGIPGGGRGTVTGTETGGTSTSSFGPTSGNATAASRAKQVFGPTFTSKGPGGAGNPGDSTKTNQYPELMGGFVDTSTRIPGAGVVAPSKNWLLSTDGSLPSSCSLGSDANSSFFPTSRCPGDMDVIPDPYRLARNYSTATYSSKTEPVPFLTDFSAFLK